MKITHKMVEFALHRLLVAQRVSVGCSLPLRELFGLWPQTTLRRSDLIGALERLRRSGQLSIDHTDEGPQLRLLDESFGLVLSGPDRVAAEALGALRESRKPSGGHLHFLLPPAAFGRRTGDHGGPA